MERASRRSITPLRGWKNGKRGVPGAAPHVAGRFMSARPKSSIQRARFSLDNSSLASKSIILLLRTVSCLSEAWLSRAFERQKAPPEGLESSPST